MIKLTPTEKIILEHLAEGKSYVTIRANLNISAASLHVHAANLRRKTGIRTNNPEHYWQFLFKRKRRNAGPTARQEQIMQLIADGHTPEQIAANLSINLQSCRNALSAGCRRARIPNTYRRAKAIKAWLAKQDLIF